MPAEVLFSGPISAGSLDDQALAFPESRPPVSWWLAFACAASVALMGFSCMGYTIYKGIGAWGNNRPVMWAFDIINFVFWIGIGHAGTLISAILFLFRQRWRTAVNRSAEAMTLFAVMCAGIFDPAPAGPASTSLFPYPNQRGLWPNFRSPRCGRVRGLDLLPCPCCSGTWASSGHHPCATGRGWRKIVYTALSLGWRGPPLAALQKALYPAGLATGLSSPCTTWYPWLRGVFGAWLALTAFLPTSW